MKITYWFASDSRERDVKQVTVHSGVVPREGEFVVFHVDLEEETIRANGFVESVKWVVTEKGTTADVFIANWRRS